MNLFNLRIAGVLIAGAIVLAGCGKSDGGSSAIGELAGAGQSATAQPAAQPTDRPTLQPAATALPLPTETPDLQPLAIVATEPAQVVMSEPTATLQPLPATATPLPAIVETCDPTRPMPTVALDAQDIAAGVVLRGQWCVEVQP